MDEPDQTLRYTAQQNAVCNAEVEQTQFQGENHLVSSIWGGSLGGRIYFWNPDTGLATLRLDGFTYLQSRDRLAPASVTTVPIAVENREGAVLILNASDLMPYRDWIEVEVLDAKTDTPVEGYEREACRDVMQDGIRIPVVWQDRPTLAGVRCGEIKLRFTLYGRARLFSFSFAGQ